VDSKVLTTTRSTWSSLIVRGRPGRNSSVNPSRRSRRNRDLHVATVPRRSSGAASTSLETAVYLDVADSRRSLANVFEQSGERPKPARPASGLVTGTAIARTAIAVTCARAGQDGPGGWSGGVGVDQWRRGSGLVLPGADWLDGRVLSGCSGGIGESLVRLGQQVAAEGGARVAHPAHSAQWAA
jgi:hypothetical protein